MHTKNGSLAPTSETLFATCNLVREVSFVSMNISPELSEVSLTFAWKRPWTTVRSPNRLRHCLLSGFPVVTLFGVLPRDVTVFVGLYSIYALPAGDLSVHSSV